MTYLSIRKHPEIGFLTFLDETLLNRIDVHPRILAACLVNTNTGTEHNPNTQD
jgi:hypothetical protein